MSDTPHVIRGGPVRARDLREAVARMGYEKGMMVTLERLLDEFAAMRTTQREHVSVTDQMADNIMTFLTISKGLGDAVDQLKRTRDLTDRVNNDGQ